MWLCITRSAGRCVCRAGGARGGRLALCTRDAAWAFVDDYEVARGVAVKNHERERIDAAMLYAMAYTARCEGGSGEMSSKLAHSL